MADLIINAGATGSIRLEQHAALRPLRAIDHLLADPPDADLEAAVVVPVRNEALALPGLIESIARQRAPDGGLFPAAKLEVLLLFSDCIDGSPEVAATAGLRFPHLRVRGVDIGATGAGIGVGMARRLLMDAAARRLERVSNGRGGVILTTDADTVVAPDWLACNLVAIGAGADAVGGQVLMKPADRIALPEKLRRRYLLDHAYQRLVDHLEGLIDPDEDDPLPRHHQHSGASFAVTVDAYWRAGGMPTLETGEDEAFFRALKRCGARFRHSVQVRSFTSGRLQGRVAEGLAGTLQRWSAGRDEPRVEAPRVVAQRLRLRARLRALHGAARVDPHELATVAGDLRVGLRWLERRLAGPRPFFDLWEEVDERRPATIAGPLPLEAAVAGLRRLMQGYAPRRSRRSSRQVA